MAKARRNLKTHPKPRDEADDPFVPPDREDQFPGAETGGTEVVNIFGKDETVDTGGGGETTDDDAAVDLNSAAEGDARSMASEGGGDAEGDGGDRRTQDDTRTARGDRRGAVRGATPQRGGNDDGQPYSNRVRQRIARERALVNRERSLREQTQRELAEERAARQAQDERIARLERAQTEIAGNSGVKDLEAQIAALRPQIIAATEGGDSTKIAELNEKLADLRTQLGILRYDLQQRQRAADATNATRRTTTATTTTPTTEVIDDPRVAELCQQFWRANRHWANRSANKAAKDDAITIDKEILADIEAGEVDFEPYSEEHFEELANRLHETYPDLEIQDQDGQPYTFENEDEQDMNDTAGRRNGGNTGRSQNGGRQQQPSRNGGRGAPPVNRMGQNGRKGPDLVENARRGRVEIDDDLRNTMRIFKVDPNDPNAKKYFARERARTILSGQDEKYGGGNR